MNLSSEICFIFWLFGNTVYYLPLIFELLPAKTQTGGLWLASMQSCQLSSHRRNFFYPHFVFKNVMWT